MEYSFYIDVDGTEIEIVQEVDDDYIYNYVTNEGDSTWAVDHFEEHANVEEWVEDYLDNLSEEELIALVAPIMGIDNA